MKTTTKLSKAEQQAKVERSLGIVTDWLNRCTNKTIYGNVTTVARSGLSRKIKFYVIVDGELLHITGHMSTILDLRNTPNGLQVEGCGSDMVFITGQDLVDLVYGRSNAPKFYFQTI